jgi:hypothetical protein
MNAQFEEDLEAPEGIWNKTPEGKDPNWLPTIAPTRSEGGMHDDYREDHPAYGMVGVSRMTGGNKALFGSDFRHNNTITITVQRANVRRGNAKDWYSAAGMGPNVVEIELSEAQWATLLSNPNVGDGVPCTIRNIMGERMPHIAPPVENRRTQLNDEITGMVEAIIERIEAVKAKAPTKKMQFDLQVVIDHLRSNLPFLARSFDKHAEDTIEKMKVEVGAYITNAIARAGVQALSGGEPPITLIGSGEEEPS